MSHAGHLACPSYPNPERQKAQTEKAETQTGKTDREHRETRWVERETESMGQSCKERNTEMWPQADGTDRWLGTDSTHRQER